MWGLGHCATGYLLSRKFFKQQKPLSISQLSMVYIMSVLIDFAHYHLARTITHSLIFFIPFLIVILWLFRKLNLIDKEHILPLAIAASSHIFADTLFGGFAYLLPFSFHEYAIFAWGSYFNLIFESVLALLMFLVLYLTHDGTTDSNTASSEPRRRLLFSIVCYWLLLVTGLVQVGMVVYLDFLQAGNFYDGKIYHDHSMWYVSLLFMTIQIVFVVIIAKLLRRNYRLLNCK